VKADELSLAAAFAAFAAGLTAQPAYRQTRHAAYCQAYRNRVAAVLARGTVRGSGAITKYFDIANRQEPIDEVRVLQEVIWPMWVHSQAVHPDWGELHRDAVMAGGFAAMTLLFCGMDFKQVSAELDRFAP
jgi:hypothetical protein